MSDSIFEIYFQYLLAKHVFINDNQKETGQM